VARRTNYGFEKKQRELRKQREEKAKRRELEESANASPPRGVAADEKAPESGPHDRD